MSSSFAAYSQSPVWSALFWVSYAAWIGSEIWILSRDRRAASGASEDRGSRRLLILLFIVGLSSAFMWGIRRRLGQIEAPVDLLMVVSLLLIWGGVGLRLWAVRTLGRFFRTSVQVLDDHRLIDTGPYARLRNPSYTGSLITLAGVGAGIGNWVSLALIIGFAGLGYARRIQVEERALARRFGAAFDAYKARRWALIPFFW
jgi:protein-S-isoprenylcysteine O-methyltransferase